MKASPFGHRVVIHTYGHIYSVFLSTEIATSTTRCHNCFTVWLFSQGCSTEQVLSWGSVSCFRTDLSWAKNSCASEILWFQAQDDSAAYSIWRKLSNLQDLPDSLKLQQKTREEKRFEGGRKALLKAWKQSDCKDIIFSFVLIILVLEVTFLYFL